MWSVYSRSLVLSCLVLKGCTSLRICAFLLDCPFYLHIVVYSSLLWYLELDTSVFLMKPALITFLWCEHKCKMREYKAGKVSPPHTEECTLIWLRNFFFFFFSFQFYCNIIDLQHWVSLRCTAQWFDLHTQWNDCHSKFREHPSSYIDIKEKKKNFPCFDAPYRMLGAGALGWPRGMVRGGRREEGSGRETRVYLWQIHVDIWQNQYNIVKLKNKIK